MEVPTILPSSTGSIETWLTIDEWIQHCSKHHRCMAGVNASWYPTRLVERTSDTTFKVVRSDSSSFQASQDRRYITLSHRWGDGDLLKLTTDNLSVLEQGLPVTLLRQTFQDTLVVAQRMNVSYIWIDSLCIIQSGDDQEDWRQESKTMEQVYSNSYCNISADWGDDLNGLFFERPPTLDRLYSLQLQWKSSNPHDKYSTLARLRHILRSKPAVHRWHIVRLLDLFEDITQSPLHHRGWVLQERLLAPRVLHFSPEQVTWECEHDIAWEKAPAFLSDSWYSLNRHSCLSDRHHVVESNMQRLRLSDGSVTARVGRWQTLVDKYTSCDLTKQSDKLVAFAGIARRLAPAEGQYVVGLWAESMPGPLLWEARRDAPRTEQSRCLEYYAPTFSWAASDCRVWVDIFSGEQLDAASATFIKHRDKPPPPAGAETIFTDHVFGPITSPLVEVRVRGILRSCRRVSEQLIPSQWTHEQAWDSLTHGCACPSSGVVDRALNLCFENGTAFRVLYDRTSDEHADAGSALYYYTIMAYSPDQRRRDSGGYSQACGLFLKSMDASMARFERVGFLSHRSQQEADIRVPVGNERDLPAWNYDESTGEHTFYIV